MATYRDDLEAARLRVQTLEAKLREREAELAQRDAALTARDAEIAELKTGREKKSTFFDNAEVTAQPQQRGAVLAVALAALLVMLAVGGFLTFRSSASAEREAMAERQAVKEAESRKREQQRAAERDAREREAAEAEKQATEAAAEREGVDGVLDAERGASAMLNVKCTPPSKVFVDGKHIGVSPIRDYAVHPGTHAISCARPDEGRKSRSVTLTAGETKTLVMVF